MLASEFLGGTEARAISLPSPLLPTGPRNVSLDSSVISQIDGLLFALRGCRLEYDILASTTAESALPRYGLRPFDSPAAILGLYLTSFDLMPLAVAAATSGRFYRNDPPRSLLNYQDVFQGEHDRKTGSKPSMTPVICVSP